MACLQVDRFIFLAFLQPTYCIRTSKTSTTWFSEARERTLHCISSHVTPCLICVQSRKFPRDVLKSSLNEQDCIQLILAKDLSGRCHEPSHARGWLPFYKQDNFLKRTKDMESTAKIVSDDWEITLKCERTWIRPIKPSNEVGLWHCWQADRQGECLLIIWFTKFLEIQTAAYSENVESTKMLFLVEFYYHS